jgi:hypothetical protein
MNNFQLYHWVNKLQSMKWWWGSLCTSSTRLIMLAHWKQPSADRNDLDSDTDSELANLCSWLSYSLGERRQIPILQSLIWPDRPRSTTFQASTQTIKPPTRLRNWWLNLCCKRLVQISGQTKWRKIENYNNKWQI